MHPARAHEILRGFKEFISRGNVVELAVAVVIGAAFGALVTSLVADLVTPLIAMIFGEPDFSDLRFTINDSQFNYGSFLNALFAFVTIAAAIYFLVVLPMNKLEERRRRGRTRTPRECPRLPLRRPGRRRRRCAFCTRLRPTLAAEQLAQALEQGAGVERLVDERDAARRSGRGRSAARRRCSRT